MPTLLVHALVASATQGLICAALIGTGMNESVFCAAIVAILVDLDHRSDEERSSLFHSLFAVLLGALILALCTTVLTAARHVTLAVSAFTGLTTHVILDMTDRNGVVIVPWRTRRMIMRGRANRMFKRRSRTDLCFALVSGSVLLVLICI